MDEQRVQLYLELINKLFVCPGGQEEAVLQQHSDLVDEGLVQVMGAAVTQLQQQGEKRQSEWLAHVVKRVAQVIGLSRAETSSGELPKDLNWILQELSQPVSNLRQMSRRVELCRQALTLLPRQENEEFWAAMQIALGNSLMQTILGDDRAQNIEEAIAVYQQVLQIKTREATPIEWATLMMNLGVAFSKRIRGDRSQNIEKAIAAYQQASEVTTRETMPIEWAQLMNNLAVAYRNRIRGDRAQNIEEAIAAYQQSLQVRTREAMPIEWAQVMNNLASAYYNRIQGDRAQNIEEAIAAYQQSLQVRTREILPTEWATSMMNLGIAYSERILGEKAQNIEEAIAISSPV